MGRAVKFQGVNRLLGPPEGVSEEQCATLPVFSNGAVCVSSWELSPEEMLQVVRTGRVWLGVWSGRTQPAVFLGSEDSTRAVVVDFGGVWPRSGEHE